MFSASAWPCSQQTLEKTSHDFKLEKDKLLTVNIDCAQMGVGGDNSWGLPVNDAYLLKPGDYQYNFRVRIKKIRTAAINTVLLKAPIGI